MECEKKDRYHFRVEASRAREQYASFSSKLPKTKSLRAVMSRLPIHWDRRAVYHHK
jgi:hypothetical protein